jgi:hypothetical protein
VSRKIGGSCPLKSAFLILFVIVFSTGQGVGDFGEQGRGFCAGLSAFQVLPSGFEDQTASFLLQQ